MVTRTVPVLRPAAVTALIPVLIFLGVNAVFGGIELVFGIWRTSAFSSAWSDPIPVIDSWVVPGLVLVLGFGLGSLIVAYAMIRRPRWLWLRPVERLTGAHWSWLATIVLGIDRPPDLDRPRSDLPAGPVAAGTRLRAIRFVLAALPWHPAVGSYLRAVREGSSS